MPVERAVTAYRSRKLNCTQSVLKGMQELLSVPDETIASARMFGGGRAPQGHCGALHAALSVAPDDKSREKIRSRFASEAGSAICREIRRTRKTPCVECVRIAAQAVVDDFHDHETEKRQKRL